MKKKIKLLGIIIFVLTLMLVQSFATTKVSAEENEIADVLLIETILPWYYNTNGMLLEKLNISYDKVGVEQLKDIEYSKYGMIIIANDQTADTYSILSDECGRFEKYVENGGVLIYGLCDYGMAGKERFISNMKLPGGIETKYNEANNAIVIDDKHPIVTGELSDGNKLIDSDITGTYASHRYILKESLPEGADIIIGIDADKATLAEYKIGNGTVIASTHTWEVSYYVGKFASKAMDDMFLYGYDKTISSLITSIITTNEKAYLPGEVLNAEIVTTINKSNKKVKAKIEIIDCKDKTVEILSEGKEQTIIAGNEVKEQISWTVGDLEPGEYKVRVIWYEGENMVGGGIGEIEILSPISLASKVSTDMTEYNRRAMAKITGYVENNTGREIKENLKGTVIVTDYENNVIKEFSEDIKGIADKEKNTYDYTIDTSNMTEGTYKVVYKVVKGNEELTIAESEFKVLEPVMLGGKLSVSKSGDRQKSFNISVKNNGTKELANLLIKIKIMDKEQKNLLEVVEQKTDLDLVKEYINKISWSDEKLSNGKYMAVLEVVTEDDIVYTLDASEFVVENISVEKSEEVLIATGKNGIKIETGIVKIIGDIYSNGNVESSAGDFNIDGIMNIVGSFKGNKTGIKELNENAPMGTFYSYIEEILSNLSDTCKKYDKVNGSTNVSLKNEIFSESTISLRAGQITAEKDIVAKKTIEFNAGSIKFGNDKKTVICSMEGDIILNAADISGNCFIYAPKGTVYINGSIFNCKGNITAESVIVRCASFNMK